jgi:hypothetical protein
MKVSCTRPGHPSVRGDKEIGRSLRRRTTTTLSPVQFRIAHTASTFTLGALANGESQDVIKKHIRNNTA